MSSFSLALFRQGGLATLSNILWPYSVREAWQHFPIFILFKTAYQGIELRGTLLRCQSWFQLWTNLLIV